MSKLPCSRTPDGQRHTLYPIYRAAEDGRRHMPLGPLGIPGHLGVSSDLLRVHSSGRLALELAVSAPIAWTLVRGDGWSYQLCRNENRTALDC